MSAPRIAITIQTADFDASAELAALRAGDVRVGAVCCFVGTVREMAVPALSAAQGSLRLSAGVSGASLVPGDGLAGQEDAGQATGISALELEHYPGMTERAIAGMANEALRRFTLHGVRVIHRVGRLALRDQIVLAAVTAGHRGAAFQGCEFLMDYLKTQAPFWKKEITPRGACWVDARETDDAALARWGIPARNAS